MALRRPEEREGRGGGGGEGRKREGEDGRPRGRGGRRGGEGGEGRAGWSGGAGRWRTQGRESAGGAARRASATGRGGGGGRAGGGARGEKSGGGGRKRGGSTAGGGDHGCQGQVVGEERSEREDGRREREKEVRGRGGGSKARTRIAVDGGLGRGGRACECRPTGARRRQKHNEGANARGARGGVRRGKKRGRGRGLRGRAQDKRENGAGKGTGRPTTNEKPKVREGTTEEARNGGRSETAAERAQGGRTQGSAHATGASTTARPRAWATDNTAQDGGNAGRRRQHATSRRPDQHLVERHGDGTRDNTRTSIRGVRVGEMLRCGRRLEEVQPGGWHDSRTRLQYKATTGPLTGGCVDHHPPTSCRDTVGARGLGVVAHRRVTLDGPVDGRRAVDTSDTGRTRRPRCELEWGNTSSRPLRRSRRWWTTGDERERIRRGGDGAERWRSAS